MFLIVSAPLRPIPVPNPFAAVEGMPRKTVGLRAVSVSAGLSSLRGGTGVLERPAFDQSGKDPLPQLHEGGDIGRVKDKKGIGNGNNYRVLLLDDVHHTEKLVAKALPEAVPSVSVSEARKLFRESCEKGIAVVIVTVKEHAEFYSQMMIRKGLRSSIEPDGNLA